MLPSLFAARNNAIKAISFGGKLITLDFPQAILLDPFFMLNVSREQTLVKENTKCLPETDRGFLSLCFLSVFPQVMLHFNVDLCTAMVVVKYHLFIYLFIYLFIHSHLIYNWLMYDKCCTF